MSEERKSALELELQDTDMSVTPNVTPNEIRNAEFNSAMRGFNREEVDEFLQNAASALESALSEAVELREDHERLQEKYGKLAGMEDALKSTLLEAQKTADTIRANAENDADLALERARGKQALIEEQSRDKIAQLQEQVDELDKIRLDYQEKIQATISSHLKIIEEISFGAELPEIPEEVDISDLEPAEVELTEIEEVSLFEPTLTDSEKASQSNDIASSEMTSTTEAETESVPEPEETPQVKESFHADLTALTDDESVENSPSTTEAIASAVENKKFSEAVNSEAEKVSSENVGDNISDDTLYKKLATDSKEASQDTEKPVGAADKASKSKAPVQSGSDGIVVFGRKEDREKAVEENARILSELDSVVDKFAEELREIDSK